MNRAPTSLVKKTLRLLISGIFTTNASLARLGLVVKIPHINKSVTSGFDVSTPECVRALLLAVTYCVYREVCNLQSGPAATGVHE